MLQGVQLVRRGYHEATHTNVEKPYLCCTVLILDFRLCLSLALLSPWVVKVPHGDGQELVGHCRHEED